MNAFSSSWLRILWFTTASLLGVMFAREVAAEQAASYPKNYQDEVGVAEIHHPLIQDWQDFRTVTGQVLLLVTPAGQAQWSVTANFSVDTVVNLDSRTVELNDASITRLSIVGDNAPPEAETLARNALRSGAGAVPLDFLLRSLPADFEVPKPIHQAAGLNMSPPRIEIFEQPRRLMLIDGPPAYSPIELTELEFVVNSDWLIFRHQASSRWFILDDKHWLENTQLAGGDWEISAELPVDFDKLALNPTWSQVAQALPPTAPGKVPIPFVISYEPTELIITEGSPQWKSIANSGINYVTNTRSDLFAHGEHVYLLLGGRWFSNKTLQGQWSTVRELPDAFSAIPADHPKGHVRASIPGTTEARLASIEAAIPRVAVVRAGKVSDMEVPYIGEPEFTPIETTRLQRAVNTPFQVLQHNNFYYLCHEGAWYASEQPVGPWRATSEVPEEIYRIPATDPAYNVTFVRAEAFDDSSDRVAYYSTSGYYGTYYNGSSLVYGTGWYSPGFHHPSAYWHYPWSAHHPGWGSPWYPYAYPYGAYPYGYPSYHHSETYDVTKREKDWRWDLDGGKRVVYEYGSQNRVGQGSYDPGNAVMYEPEDQRSLQANTGDDDLYTGKDGGIYRRVSGQWQKQQGEQWVIQPEGMIRYDLEQQFSVRHSAYRDYDRYRARVRPR